MSYAKLAANVGFNAFKALIKGGGRMMGYGGRGAELFGTSAFGRSMQQMGRGMRKVGLGMQRGGSLMGGLGVAGTGASSPLAAGRAGRMLMSQGMSDIAGAGRGMWNWASGGTMGQRAARLGAGYLGVRSAADFLNPWGLGWGD